MEGGGSERRRSVEGHSRSFGVEEESGCGRWMIAVVFVAYGGAGLGGSSVDTGGLVVALLDQLGSAHRIQVRKVFCLLVICSRLGQPLLVPHGWKGYQ